MAMALIVLGALLEMALAITVRDFSLMNLAVDVAGNLALYAPTEVEALRRLMRERPAAAAFGRRSEDRRRPARAAGTMAMPRSPP